MVPLARPPSDSSDRELVCAVLSDSVPLREMLSLMLTRLRIGHHTFTRVDDLLAQVDAIVRRGTAVRFVVMVGPGLGEAAFGGLRLCVPGWSATPWGRGERAARRAATERLDAALAAVPGSVDLVVFEDPLEGEALSWSRVQPRLRCRMPPRIAELLRVIDDG